MIPAVAVQRGPQGAFVYVAGDDGRAAMRPVTVERIEGETALVAKGLTAGEQVVSEGQNQLRPGARVQVRQPQPQQNDERAPAGGGESKRRQP